MMKQSIKKIERGFTLLLAVLISSILIALGSAIFDIISKEIVLTSSGRESQFAFYAADTGSECALYWDFQHNAFATTSYPLASINCAGVTIVAPELTQDLQNSGTPTETLVTRFEFPLGGGTADDPCAIVEVTREHSPIRTTIISAGYNTCNVLSSQRLERAIRVSY